MTEYFPRHGRATGLMHPSSEREELDRLIDAVRTGQTQALVTRSDPTWA